MNADLERRGQLMGRIICVASEHRRRGVVIGRIEDAAHGAIVEFVSPNRRGNKVMQAARQRLGRDAVRNLAEAEVIEIEGTADPVLRGWCDSCQRTVDVPTDEVKCRVEQYREHPRRRDVYVGGSR